MESITRQVETQALKKDYAAVMASWLRYGNLAAELLKKCGRDESKLDFTDRRNLQIYRQRQKEMSQKHMGILDSADRLGIETSELMQTLG